MPKFIPKLFKTPMVKAILEDRKSVTRRLLELPDPYSTFDLFKPNYYESIKPCQVGDIMWVRETFCPTTNEYLNSKTTKPYFYKADIRPEDEKESKKTMKDFGFVWKPSLFMPKEACRLFLEINEIKMSRLQDITAEEAIQEGISMVDDNPILYNNYLFGKDVYWKGYGSIKKTYGFTNPIDSYRSLWDLINKDYCSWTENPYVWEYKFKVLDSEPEGFRN
jgi:hypothetical protein